MTFLRNAVLRFLLLCMGLMVGAGAMAQATSFPNRPIKLVVPFVPGGTLDVVARLLARNMQDSLKQAVVVENRASAGGVVGVDYVAKS